MATSSDAALQYHPFSGRVSVFLFGRPLDWNISGDEEGEVKRRIGKVVGELGIATNPELYAPRPSTFNAHICAPGDLTDRTTLEGSDVTLCRGCDADGVVLRPQSAFWLSSADCITIIAHDPGSGQTVAAHGGRDCLIDRERIKGGKRRQFESVVHAIANTFSNRKMAGVKVFMTCGIGPENFSHPVDHEKYGLDNAKMAFDIQAKWGLSCIFGNPFQGKISLPEVIRSQFIDLGVSPHNIGYDGVETFEDRGQDGNYRWWSYRRGDGKKRNGVLVVRHW